MNLKEDLTKIYDAHTHFDDHWYEEEGYTTERLIKEAELAGVGYFNNVAFDLVSSVEAIKQVEPFNNAFAIIGIHPNEIKNHSLQDFKTLVELTKNPKVVGIGECGLDYYYSKNDKPFQKKWFEMQIDLANQRNLVLMMHIRDDRGVYTAYDDVIEILKTKTIQKKVVHCFSADKEYAKKFLDLDCYIEIGGAVTFKNAKDLQEAVLMIPLERMLVETDAPYLAPHPFRGEMNFTKNIVLTVEKIADLKKISVQEVIAATTKNAFELFLNEKIREQEND